MPRHPSTRLPVFIVPLFCVGLLVAVGCATTDGEGVVINYSKTAKENYKKGKDELASRNFIEALTLFNHVRQKFPFSRYAVLAELARADTYFERGSYLAAVDAYKTFLGSTQPTQRSRTVTYPLRSAKAT